MEKEKYILSSKNEMMPFKSLTMYQYQLIKFVMKQKLQPFFFFWHKSIPQSIAQQGALMLTGFVIEHVHFIL